MATADNSKKIEPSDPNAPAAETTEADDAVQVERKTSSSGRPFTR